MIQTLLEVVLPVFVVIGFGYVSVWKGYFPVSGIDGVMRFAQNFAIPCLLFQAIAKIDIAASFNPALLASFYIGATAGFGLGFLAARLIFKRDVQDSIAIGFCCLFSNSLLLGLPITERAYGAGMLDASYAIIAFHAPYCYLVGITAMELSLARGAGVLGAMRKVLTAITHNALFIAIVLGFAWNIAGFSIPQVMDDGLSLVARAALPAALFALGGVLVQYRPEGDKTQIAVVCCIALLVHPAITYGLGTTLALPPESFKPAVLTAAMAPGFNAYIFANMYGRAKRVAASSVLVATGASILTAWLWLTILG